MLVVAGGLIGYGAKRAGGCTSGNGLGGCSLGSPASFAATATFMGVAIVTSFVIKGAPMRKKAAAVGFGVAFGFLISWGQFTDPDRIREMLTLSDSTCG